MDDAGIGDTVRLPDSGGTVAVEATAVSIFPMFRLELVHCGRVIATADSESGARELRISENVAVDKPGWPCVRVDGGGPEDLVKHRDEWQRAIMAHTSPVYLACGAREHPGGRLGRHRCPASPRRGPSRIPHHAPSSKPARSSSSDSRRSMPA